MTSLQIMEPWEFYFESNGFWDFFSLLGNLKDFNLATLNRRQFTNRFVLHDTVKLDSLQSKWTKEGKLVIEAEKCAAIEAEARQFEIKLETDEDKTEE